MHGPSATGQQLFAAKLADEQWTPAGVRCATRVPVACPYRLGSPAIRAQL
jgi:hypothetical protein